MSQFWAMLKDSYREAVDGWIFLVMLVLGGVVVGLVASASVTPVAADLAVPRMIGGGDGPGQSTLVAGDRGAGTKPAFFFYKPDVADVKSAGGDDGRPWAAPLTFTVTYRGGGNGAAGADVEVDDKGQPKLDPKKAKDALILGDPFKEAVRYWAAKPGEPKPAYTDELGREFVTATVADATGLTVTDAVKQKAAGGGFLNMFATPPTAFTVTTSGGSRLGWAHRPAVLFGAVSSDTFSLSLGRLVYLIESTLLNSLGAWVILLTGVVVTAGFVPNMMRKGGIDLLLSKPLSRPQILVYKYLGGLLFVFLVTAATVAGVWLAVGVRTGVWATGLLWAVGGITFYFAVLYALSTLVGVLTRNGIVSIIVTVLFWFAVWLIGFTLSALVAVNMVADAQQQLRPAAKADAQADPPPPIPAWLISTLEIANRVTPRTNDLDELTTKLIADDLLPPTDRRQNSLRQKGLSWAETLGVATAYIVLFLGLATARFVTRSH